MLFRSSIYHLDSGNPKDLGEFYKWFVGFSDAESMFGISPILNGNKIEGFSFRFIIGLHKDDLNTLNYIKSKLGMGYINAYKDSQIFTISKKDGIKTETERIRSDASNILSDQ